MIETLEHIDQQWLLAINGMHSPFFDDFFTIFSSQIVWLPLLLVFLFLLFKHEKTSKNFAWVLLFIILTIVLSDQISSGIIKPAFHRLRPTHEPCIANFVHIVHGYSGGLYGFVSSHAANSMAFAIFTTVLFRSKPYGIAVFSWAALTAYSRMYLGVHYPGDILGGMIVGVLSAILSLWMMSKFAPKKIEISKQTLEKSYALIFIFTLIITISVITIFHRQFLFIA